jgi:hypothetical protein
MSTFAKTETTQQPSSIYDNKKMQILGSLFIFHYLQAFH